MTSRAKLHTVLVFAALAATGCAAEKEDHGTAAPSSEAEVRGGGDACIAQMPIEVWSIAAHLDLGAPKSASGAAGSMYYELGGGAVVRWSNVESKVSEVRLVAKEGEGAGTAGEVPLPVALAASTNVLGAYVGEEGAAGSLYFTFARGVVRWSNVESKVSEVKRTDGSKAGPAKALAASKKTGSACLESLPKPVWNMAARLDLGPALESDGAAGSMYFTFANGSVLRWSNVESKLSEVKLVAKEGEGSGAPSEVPLEVADAAASKAFGSYISSDGAAGSLYFTFERGTVRWSNVESEVSEVLPK